MIVVDNKQCSWSEYSEHDDTTSFPGFSPTRRMGSCLYPSLPFLRSEREGRERTWERGRRWRRRCYLASNPHETALSLTHFILDDFSNYSRRSLHQIPFFVVVSSVSWFVLIDLYMSIQSRRSYFIEIIRTLILFFIMLHIYGVATATESYFLPLL